MDVTQALKDAENALRDFIGAVLDRSLGPKWVDQCGVTSDRINQWRERQEIERRRQTAGVVDERLIYYADFYDLRTILQKNWSGEFAEAFGEWRAFEVDLARLEKLRDPDAHRRELLPHQKHLIMGISGEIRTKIVRSRSKKETSADCFPRIESARDNYGNIWTPAEGSLNAVSTNTVLRPGDTVEFLITASDPEDMPLEYGFEASRGLRRFWLQESTFSLPIEENHIGKIFRVEVFIKSPRTYHAHQFYDDSAIFLYQVLPAR